MYWALTASALVLVAVAIQALNANVQRLIARLTQIGRADSVTGLYNADAFTEMLRAKGDYRGTRILSAASVAQMTSDQLTPEQKKASDFTAGFFDHHGWGLGLSVKTGDDGTPRGIGTYGWDGGMGTGWSSDPRNDVTTILMTQASWTSPSPSNMFLDFWTSAYQAIDD